MVWDFATVGLVIAAAMTLAVVLWAIASAFWALCRRPQLPTLFGQGVATTPRVPTPHDLSGHPCQISRTG
jgi:hypothetical protein